MKPKFIFYFAVVLDGGLFGFANVSFGNEHSLQRQLEQIAQTNAYFSLTVIIQNRPLRLWPPMVKERATNGFKIFKMGTNMLAAEQSQLLDTLRALSKDNEALKALLKNPNPKVRTLALGVLFQREDGRDLPLIASLINDSAQTFPNLHNPSPGGEAGPRPLSEITNSQMVGDVAQAMLAFWGVRHEGETIGPFFGKWEGPHITTSDFAKYWQKYTGRKYSASWFAVKMKRATRDTDPVQPEYRADIDRVIADMRALPASDGPWIQLYVLAPGNQFTTRLIPDDDLIAVAKEIGPDALLRFLQRQPVGTDPDLRLDKDDELFLGISDFILDHADKLLPAKDADALLACEYVERDSGGINPAWPIGAALLQPARAHEILHDALGHETRTYETAAGELAGALWRVCGPAEIPFLVNWFYTELPTASEPMHQPVAFLWGVEAAARPDTKQLMAALVKDPRFDRTDWNVLKEILKIVDTGRVEPLVSVSDIYEAQPNGLLDERMVLPAWRNLLRREYGLPEEPLSAALAVPEQVFTQPAWSVAVPRQEDRGGQWCVAPSPDGQWLALLSRQVVTLWRADTGKLAWQPPSVRERAGDYPAVAGDVAFMATGQLLIFDHGDYGRFLAWDPATHQETSKVLLSGKPSSGVDDGRYSFDGAAQRMAFVGYNDLCFFDTRTGAALWMHPGEGGVNIHAALSADGTRLAVGGGMDYPNVVRLYDAVTGERLRQFDSLDGRVLALAFSSNGRWLATATAAGGLQLWDCATGKILQSYAWQVPGWGMGQPIFSADGQWLAAVGFSSAIGAHEIGIFNTDTGRLKWVIRFQTDSSFGADMPLAFSPDGKFLYTATDRIEAWRLK